MHWTLLISYKIDMAVVNVAKCDIQCAFAYNEWKSSSCLWRIYCLLIICVIRAGHWMCSPTFPSFSLSVWSEDEGGERRGTGTGPCRSSLMCTMEISQRRLRNSIIRPSCVRIRSSCSLIFQFREEERRTAPFAKLGYILIMERTEIFAANICRFDLATFAGNCFLKWCWWFPAVYCHNRGRLRGHPFHPRLKRR